MPVQEHSKVTGLSGNEIFCLKRLNYAPGQLCVGNNVVSLGAVGGIKSGLSTLAGGEIEQITRLIYDGRKNAFDRILQEAHQFGGSGLTGVSFDLINHGSNLEFLAIGSTVKSKANPAEPLGFSTSADAQQLYCQLDS
ncbi:MAG: heavy metal-binding domain-containing protein, partial [Candidatus Omnitrophica bacterium]|nr:heavy metal-binding domain-containing protein [Candidatus Omnitrophota bacterium]